MISAQWPPDFTPASGAVISQDKLYRYLLWRVWDATLPVTVFIMLNPSTADAMKDDPTIRRCIEFAKTWGYGGIRVVNLYAFRATEPAELYHATDPIGPDNVWTIEQTITRGGSLVIAAWGNHGAFRSRSVDMHILADRLDVKLAHLGLTKLLEPRHPLYVPGLTKPQYWPEKIR